MSDGASEHLDGLRVAATKADWRRCELHVFQLYHHLTAEHALGLGLDLLAAHLDTFEELHPDIDWPRTFLGMVDAFDTDAFNAHTFPLQSEVGIFDADGTASPGSEAYLDALSSLQDAVTSYIEGDTDAACQTASGIPGSAIHAQVRAFAAATCPDAYDAMQPFMGDIRLTEEYSQDEMAKRERAQDAYAACTGAVQKNLWLHLADAIAERL
jgi:hypothetical protein